MQELDTLARWIREAQHMAVLTGAGMSTESGVPDFRSSKGLWTKFDPFVVSHVDTLEQNYEAFQEFYAFRIRELAKVEPNAGHRVLARWQQDGLLQFLATQNVENLQQRAGSPEVTHLHGNLLKIHCHMCGLPATREDFLELAPCRDCSGVLRPDITLFGEMLPEAAWSRAFQEISRSDLLLVIGTSLQVSPVNQLPQAAGGRVAILNLDETPFDRQFDLILRGKAGEVLQQVEERLRAQA
ncbi:SIR2 family NAD-dependent protein deacylase [Ectobacillus ponti]|uniref:protein acetyllysine N-acetyltransferase n=1 Tax=Ectobacillus ponti TaxID=2961894 RepID=A0AA42BND8_9BACI|nr:NAD-dependent deacylase [Ectobacillus ponti]MCP8967885.1 NAD-dependent deacylase [Ectobacillus ponti]